MPRVIGIDPGTISVDLCGIEDGQLFLDRSLPTGDALADPAALLATLEHFVPLDLIAGPSGYGLPLVAATDLTENDLRLASRYKAVVAIGTRDLAGNRLDQDQDPTNANQPKVWTFTSGSN